MINKTGLYIHIPFCVRKCNYCAFLSFDALTMPRKEYTDALCNEIRLRAKVLSADSYNKKGAERIALDTVYVGGGTPSVLDVSQMRDIMHTVKTSFDIKPDAEITIEVNPGTLGVKDGVTKAKLTAYKSIGFNRLSMGVQSMDNDTLQFLGRIHTAENITRDVRLIREAGFDNLNLDLIFSIPCSGNAEGKEEYGSKERALEDARKIIALEPEHISCYSLQIEEGTPFAEMIDRGELSEVPDEEDRDTYHAICKLLKDSGYEHYEISNFAKMPGSIKAQGFQRGSATTGDGAKSPYRSHHNSSYWDMSDYIGVGLGASGFAGGKRYKNISDINEYIKTYSSDSAARVILRNNADFEFVHEEEHLNGGFDNISEAVFTGLRRREGISYEDATAIYRRGKDAERVRGFSAHDINDAAGGNPLSDEEPDALSAKEVFWSIFSEAKQDAEIYADKGLLIIDDDGIRLTEQGIDISNMIMALFV